jgi:hypothetical protein
MTSILRKDIYNLEFPTWIHEMNIGGYRFTRVPNYKERLIRLQHLIQMTAEFSISPNTGENAITAHVEGPAHEASVVLSDVPGTTALDDVILLLSIFTLRDVFTVDPNADGVIIADPRLHFHGGILRCSIVYKTEGQDKYGNVGFAETLNKILSLIRDPAWQQKYDNGHFIVLANQAFKHQPLETSFTQCWTIWEHLFAALNRAWMSDDMLRRVGAREKIAFILYKYALRESIDKNDSARIQSLADIRNRLVHYGRFPERETVLHEAELFCQITEFVIAKIFDLGPSNLFNTVEKFEAFLKEKSNPGAKKPPAAPKNGVT